MRKQPVKWSVILDTPFSTDRLQVYPARFRYALSAGRNAKNPQFPALFQCFLHRLLGRKRFPTTSPERSFTGVFDGLKVKQPTADQKRTDGAMG